MLLQLLYRWQHQPWKLWIVLICMASGKENGKKQWRDQGGKGNKQLVKQAGKTRNVERVEAIS
jgi:hypothetical protein